MFNYILNIITGKCPVCREGQIFHTFWEMHTHCPVCKVNFYRESGYFTMAIFVSYILAGVLIVPTILIGFLLGLDAQTLMFLTIAMIILPIPWIYRYGRIIWMYTDQRLDPRTRADSLPQDQES